MMAVSSRNSQQVAQRPLLKTAKAQDLISADVEGPRPSRQQT